MDDAYKEFKTSDRVYFKAHYPGGIIYEGFGTVEDKSNFGGRLIKPDKKVNSPTGSILVESRHGDILVLESVYNTDLYKALK